MPDVTDCYISSSDSGVAAHVSRLASEVACVLPVYICDLSPSSTHSNTLTFRHVPGLVAALSSLSLQETLP